MLYTLFRQSVSMMDPKPVVHSATPLTSVGTLIWRADRTIKFALGIELPLSMVVVANEHGELLLYSPTPLDDRTQAAIDSIGTVRWIVSPNPLHGHFVSRYRQIYRDADYVTPAQVPMNQWRPWFDLIRVETRDGYAEICGYHRASHTLILSDLAFNVRSANTRTEALLRLNGAWQQFTPTRMQRLLVMKNRAALQTFYRWAMDQDFSQISVSHGALVTNEAPAAFAQAFARWQPS